MKPMIAVDRKSRADYRLKNVSRWVSYIKMLEILTSTKLANTDKELVSRVTTILPASKIVFAAKFTYIAIFLSMIIHEYSFV